MGSPEVDASVARLQELGYKQELKRELSLFTNFAVSFSIISILTGITTTFATGYNNGGPVAMVWGWVICSFFSFIVGLSMAEICSTYPTSGGLYFWSSQLAGSWGPLAAWVTGWFNLLGQVAVTAGIDYGLAQFIGQIILLTTGNATGGGYQLTKYGTLAIYAAILVAHGLINTFGVKALAILNGISVWWHILVTAVIICMLPVVAPTRQSASWVFAHFTTNEAADLPSSTYTFFLGLLMAQYTLTGYDASAHMTEETKNADVAGPIGILMAIGVSSIVGLGYILALLFSIQNPDYLVDANNETAGSYPSVQIFYDAFQGRYGSSAGAVTLLILIGIAIFFCGLSSLTSNSRMIYAFTRDGALPGSRLWHKVNSTFKVPVNAIWLATALSFLLALPSLKNSVAFTAVLSIATIGLYISYVLPVFFRIAIMRDRFPQGPFSLGRYSYINGTIACLWVGFITVLFVLPTSYPVTRGTFNYASASVGGVLVLSLGWWVLDARRWFKGPVPNVAVEDYHKEQMEKIP